MFVFGFVFQFLCHMPQRSRLFFFFLILFVPLSHCYKHKFGFLHWINETNKNLFVALIYCNKQNLYTLQKFAESVTNAQLFGTLIYFFGLLGNFIPFFGVAFFEDIFRHFNIFLLFFCNFLVTYINLVCRSDSVQQTQILFVAVGQCDKQKFSFCRSDSVRQTIMKKISNFFVECIKEIGWKAKN